MIDIIFEDDYCIVVNKPNNILVHHSYYARNITDDSLLQMLKKQIDLKLFPVHRLDRKTSGLILLAKNKNEVAEFQKLFDNQNITKKYYAMVRGFCEHSGIIDSRVKNPDTNVYKDALTHYKLIESVETNIAVAPYPTSRYSILELEPKTGRTHQLRKHLNKIAHPIIGDHKYGNRHHNQMFSDKFGIDNLYLHAKSLVFTHPFTNDTIQLTTELPQFWLAPINLFAFKKL